MSLKYNLNLPQKSIFGFKVLSSFHSSLSCYLLLLFGKILNPLFGSSEIEIKAGALFNIVLNISVLILILNLFMKRKQIRKKSFILLNSLLFIYLPYGSDQEIWTVAFGFQPVTGVIWSILLKSNF